MSHQDESRFRYEPEETILYQSVLFTIVRRSLRDIKTGEVQHHEMARRPPGVRVILRTKDDTSFLMLREYRHEYGEWDIRLPGGKVFDAIADMPQLAGQPVAVEAEKAAHRELNEELGIQVDSLEFLTRQRLGATIEWDLYFYSAIVSRQVLLSTQSLGFGEDLTPVWLTKEELRREINEGTFKEARSLPVLFKSVKGLCFS